VTWKRGTFKDSEVWVAVDDAGKPVVQSGRTQIRYSRDAGAKVYRAGASRVSVDPSAPAEDLDAGEAAPAKGGKTSRRSGFGSAGTRTARQAALAKEAAHKLLDELDPDVVRAYTDGACRGNPGPAGAGAVVELPDGRRGEASRALGRGTNNVGELTAVALALDLLEDAGVSHDTPVALLSDSSYVNGVLTRGWKAKANRDLILPLRSRLDEWPNLEILWVAGHAGTAGNERADVLANRGVDGLTATAWS